MTTDSGTPRMTRILCGCAGVALLETLPATIGVCAIFGSRGPEISQLPKETKCATQ